MKYDLIWVLIPWILVGMLVACLAVAAVLILRSKKGGEGEEGLGVFGRAISSRSAEGGNGSSAFKLRRPEDPADAKEGKANSDAAASGSDSAPSVDTLVADLTAQAPDGGAEPVAVKPIPDSGREMAVGSRKEESSDPGLEAELVLLRNRVAELSAELEEERAARARLSAAASRSESGEARLAVLAGQLELAKSELMKAEAEIAALKAAAAERDAAVAELKAAKAAPSNGEELERARAAVLELNERLAAAEDSASEKAAELEKALGELKMYQCGTGDINELVYAINSALKELRIIRGSDSPEALNEAVTRAIDVLYKVMEV